MSYILDALKKAEAERRRSKGPDIMTEPARGKKGTEKHPWVYVLLIILAAAAGSAGWFLGHEKNPSQQTAMPQAMHNYIPPVQTADQAPAEKAPSQMQAKIQTPANEPSTQPKTLPRNEGKAVVQDKKRDDASLVISRETKTEKNRPASKPAQENPEGTVQPRPEKKNIPNNRIYAFNELPESVRQELPALVISTHIYSPDKSERLASINGHIGREGQEIMPGISVESITPDGAVLRYQGYRFKVGLK